MTPAESALADCILSSLNGLQSVCCNTLIDNNKCLACGNYQPPDF